MSEYQTWAVVSDEGLTLYINLTEQEALQLAFERRQRSKLSWAVTMEEAAELQAAWTYLGELYAAKRRLARLRTVTEFLQVKGAA